MTLISVDLPAPFSLITWRAMRHIEIDAIQRPHTGKAL
jgi:hypothetical protein